MLRAYLAFNWCVHCLILPHKYWGKHELPTKPKIIYGCPRNL